MLGYTVTIQPLIVTDNKVTSFHSRQRIHGENLSHIHTHVYHAHTRVYAYTLYFHKPT